MHVHVSCADGEAKFWLEPDIALARNYRLSESQLRDQSKRSYRGYSAARMNSEPLGIGTSTVEVTNISRHGIWLLVGDRELFLAYENFPWFREAPISKIVNVEEPTPEHFYWPDLDVDLGLRTIEHPEEFPLKAGGNA